MSSSGSIAEIYFTFAGFFAESVTTSASVAPWSRAVSEGEAAECSNDEKGELHVDWWLRWLE